MPISSTSLSIGVHVHTLFGISVHKGNTVCIPAVYFAFVCSKEKHSHIFSVYVFGMV